MEFILLIILFSLVGGVFSLVGGIILLIKESWAKAISLHLLSFAAGVLLGVTFFNLLPESLEIFIETVKPHATLFLFVFLGFLLFFFIEGLLQIIFYHGHSAESILEGQERRQGFAPWLFFIGDSIHNFIDGVAITASFLVSIPLGIGTALAVASHEIPHEIGDFSVMIHAGWKRKRIIFWNVLSALMTTVGALIALYFKAEVMALAGEILALVSGMFLYIAAANLIPELYRLPRRVSLWQTLPILLFGVLVVLAISRILPE